jgi:hypothetical protein
LGPTNQPGTELKALVEHWSVGCSSGDCSVADAIKYWDGVELHYWSEPDSKLEINSLGPEQTREDKSMGDFVVNAPVFGVQIFGVFRAGCGDTVDLTMPIEARSDPIVLPPNLPDLNQIAVVVDDPSFPRGFTVVEPSQIPLNYRFHIHTNIMADPRGAEVVKVRVAGAGIDFTKNYPADPNVPISEQLYNDPDADLMAIRPEPIKFWVEFEGVSSPTRQLMVVPYDQDGAPLLGNDGGSDGGGSDGGGSDGGGSDGGGSGGQAGATDPSSGAGATAASAGDSATPSDGGAAGRGSSANAGSSPSSSGKSGGCAMAQGRSRGSALLALVLAALGSASLRARRARSFKSLRA